MKVEKFIDYRRMFSGLQQEEKTVRLHFMFTVLILFLAMCLSNAGTGVAQPPKEITNSIGMKLVLIPKGTFTMGSPPSEAYSNDSERQHEVTLSEDYYLGAFEVTQAQYLKVMGVNPSYYQGDKVVERHPQTGRVVKEVDCSNRPVECVAWHEAVEFCVRLSHLPDERKARRVYRLPTEAEWEYACRAGSKTAYSFGDNGRDLGKHGWFGNNSGTKQLDFDYVYSLVIRPDNSYSDAITSAGCATHPVGEKKPNAWGLYDMHGNVSEWCSDWSGEYPKKSVIDPMGPKGGTHRVIRGRGYESRAQDCRSAARNSSSPWGRSIEGGFRVALSPFGSPE